MIANQSTPKRHITIPIFVPHLGCPHDCVFCNQRKITGVDNFSLDDAKSTIESCLLSARADAEIEIAFFGGSFTGIDRTLMIELLALAKSYLDAGKITGIRCSTRPDYIDEEILDILWRYSLRTIEIGVQSMSDTVLKASARGHLAKTTIEAMDMITSRGFELVGQMMLGLPCSTLEDELLCARTICAHGASAARIYPTAVFENTPLHKMLLRGEYIPITLQEAVRHCARVMEVFVGAEVKLLRIGLCETDSLYGSGGIVAGGYHPALGEMCISEYYFNKISEQLDRTLTAGRDIVISIPKNSLSKAIGQKKSNKIRITEKYSPRSLRFVETEELPIYTVRADVR